MERVRAGRLLARAAGVGAALVAAREWARRRRTITLRDRVVLITGASRGLGLVLARAFAGEGAQVALCARDPEELARAQNDLRERGTEAFFAPFDVTDRAQAEEGVRQVVAHFGRIDILVNNAGVIEVGPMEEMTHQDYERAMRTHFWGPLHVIQAVLPQMRARRDGRIVNISSIGGKISVPHLLPYSASKFALVGLSEGLRAELVKEGIYVTTVCPGLMRTGSPRNATFKGQHRAEYVWFALSDSSPLTSISAESAARQILDACRKGDAEVVLSLPAQIATTFHALFPGVTADLLGLVNRALPGPGGVGTAGVPGKDSESAIAPSILTALNERAARDNNEIP